MFLASVGLDKPFTGGIGSYKLYVMVAFLLNQQGDYVRSMSSGFQSSNSLLSSSLPSSSVSKIEVEKDHKMNQNRPDLDLKSEVDLGYLLVAFFHHYGNPNNLNSDTIVRVKIRAYRPDKEGRSVGREGEGEGKGKKRIGKEIERGEGLARADATAVEEGEILEAEADFTRSMQILACQKLFQAAHTVLVQDLKSCTPSKAKGSMRRVGVSTEIRNVRSLGWLRSNVDKGSSR